MARLPKHVQRFVVEQLACFAGLSDVIRAVKDEFGLEVSPQQVDRYDPAKAASRDGLAKEWRELHAATRRRFLQETDSIAIAHRAYRLGRLDQMARKAEQRGNLPLAAALLKQAAQEVGDVYTNRRRLDVEPREALARLLGLSADELPEPSAAVCNAGLRKVS